MTAIAIELEGDPEIQIAQRRNELDAVMTELSGWQRRDDGLSVTAYLVRDGVAVTVVGTPNAWWCFRQPLNGPKETARRDGPYVAVRAALVPARNPLGMKFGA